MPLLALLISCRGKEDSKTPGITPATDAPPQAVAPVAPANTRNQPPVIVSASISPNPARAPDTLKIEVTANDPDKDGITYQYQWSVNGQIVAGEVQSDLRPGSYQKGDSVTCQVTAFDGLNSSTPAETKAVTIENTPPKILGIEYTPKYPGKNTGLELTVQTEDPDQDVLQTSFKWFHEGKPIDGVDGPRLEGSLLKKQTYFWARVVVTDGTAHAEKFTLKIPIANSAPVITSEPPKLPPGSQTSYTYQAQAKDPDEDPVTFSATGPEGVAMAADGKMTWTPRKDQVGTSKIRVVAKDKEGAEATQEYEITVSFPKPKESP